MCRYARSRRDKRFRGEAAWSICAAKQEKYYGFKAGVLMNSAGEIFRWWPANIDEREMLDASAIPVRRQGADLRRLQLARIMHDGARPVDFVFVRQGLKG